MTSKCSFFSSLSSVKGGTGCFVSIVNSVRDEKSRKDGRRELSVTVRDRIGMVWFSLTKNGELVISGEKKG